MVCGTLQKLGRLALYQRRNNECVDVFSSYKDCGEGDVPV